MKQMVKYFFFFLLLCIVQLSYLMLKPQQIPTVKPDHIKHTVLDMLGKWPMKKQKSYFLPGTILKIDN